VLIFILFCNKERDRTRTGNWQCKRISNAKESAMKEKIEITDRKPVDEETEIDKAIDNNTDHKVEKRGSIDQNIAEEVETECSN
jgi:pyruvate/2-oxoacid:ferredoxin oxidoreductase beta subunit